MSTLEVRRASPLTVDDQGGLPQRADTCTAEVDDTFLLPPIKLGISGRPVQSGAEWIVRMLAHGRNRHRAAPGGSADFQGAVVPGADVHAGIDATDAPRWHVPDQRRPDAAAAIQEAAAASSEATALSLDWAGGSVCGSLAVDGEGDSGFKGSLSGAVDLVQGVSASVSGWAAVQAVDDTRVLRWSEDHDRAYLRKSSAVGVSGGATVSLATPWQLGLDAGMTVARGRGVVLERWVDGDQVDELTTRTGTGRLRSACALWKAASCVRSPDTVPDGTVVKTETMGTLQGSAVIHAGPLSVGMSGTQQGSFLRTVRRVGEGEDYVMEVAFQPTKLKGKGIFSALPGLEAGFDSTATVAGTQGFRFHMRNPEARSAYQRALQGVLPGRLTIRAGAGHEEVHALMGAWALEADKLGPQGIERLHLEQISLKRSEWHWSITPLFRLVGRHRHREVENFVACDGTRVLSRDVVTGGLTVQTARSGDEAYGASATLERVHTVAGDEQDGPFVRLLLGLSFEDTKLTGGELRAVVDQMNRGLHLGLDAPRRTGGKGSAMMGYQAALLRPHLQALSDVGVAQVEAVVAVELPDGEQEAHRTGLTSMVAAMGSPGATWTQKAQAVQAYVKAFGPRAVTTLDALIRSLDDCPPVPCMGNEDRGIYHEAEEAIFALMARYRHPVRVAEPDLAQRFDAAYAAVQLVEEAMLAHDDGVASQKLAPEAWLARLGHLQDLARSGLQCVDLAHLEPARRKRVLKKIRPAWVTHKVRVLRARHDEAWTGQEDLPEVLGRVGDCRRTLRKLEAERSRYLARGDEDGAGFSEACRRMLESDARDVRELLSFDGVRSDERLRQWHEELTGRAAGPTGWRRLFAWMGRAWRYQNVRVNERLQTLIEEELDRRGRGIEADHTRPCTARPVDELPTVATPVVVQRPRTRTSEL